MKLVRSFDEFIKEAADPSVAPAGTTNAANAPKTGAGDANKPGKEDNTGMADKFKIETRKAGDGEVANFKVVLREFKPDRPMPELVLLSAMAKPEFSKFAMDKSLIGFINVTKQRESGFATPRELLKAIIIFKKAEGFDTSKAKPVVSLNGVSLFDVNDAAKMKATEKTIAQVVNTEVKQPENTNATVIQEMPPAPVVTTTNPKPEESKNKDYDLVKDLEADKDVIEFLKSKLLNADKPKFSKSSAKVLEIKGLQMLISKFTLADKKSPSAAASLIKKSGIDGVYGDGTANAIAATSKDSSKPVATISMDNITDFAKWCKFMGYNKAEVEKIFNSVTLEGGDKKKGEETETAGPKYYFVNKGWTYSEDQDPYKTK